MNVSGSTSLEKMSLDGIFGGENEKSVFWVGSLPMIIVSPGGAGAG